MESVHLLPLILETFDVDVGLNHGVLYLETLILRQ